MSKDEEVEKLKKELEELRAQLQQYEFKTGPQFSNKLQALTRGQERDRSQLLEYKMRALAAEAGFKAINMVLSSIEEEVYTLYKAVDDPEQTTEDWVKLAMEFVLTWQGKFAEQWKAMELLWAQQAGAIQVHAQEELPSERARRLGLAPIPKEEA